MKAVKLSKLLVLIEQKFHLEEEISEEIRDELLHQEIAKEKLKRNLKHYHPKSNILVMLDV